MWGSSSVVAGCHYTLMAPYWDGSLGLGPPAVQSNTVILQSHSFFFFQTIPPTFWIFSSKLRNASHICLITSTLHWCKRHLWTELSHFFLDSDFHLNAICMSWSKWLNSSYSRWDDLDLNLNVLKFSLYFFSFHKLRHCAILCSVPLCCDC